MNALTQSHATAPQRGSALVMALFVLLLLAGLSAAFLLQTQAQSRFDRAVLDECRALDLAEAGLDQSTSQLALAKAAEVGSLDDPARLGNGVYYVESEDLGGNLLALRSTSASGTALRRLELVVKKKQNPAYPNGVVANEWGDLASNCMIDSYNSTIGSYAAQAVNNLGGIDYAAKNGDVGSNGALSLDANSTVFGDATSGPGQSVTLASNVTITGLVGSAKDLIAFPPIVVPVIAPSPPVTAKKGAAVKLTGFVHLASLVVSTGGKVEIVGPATVVLDSLLVTSNAQLDIDASQGPVKIYGTGTFDLRSNSTIVTTTHKPADLALYLTGDNVAKPSLTIAFSSNTSFTGTIYAPDALVQLSSTFTLYGSLKGRRVQLASNSKLHYDEALLDAEDGVGFSYPKVCWRELAKPAPEVVAALKSGL